jgi:NitT/TauT family transport system substrate-binding protein
MRSRFSLFSSAVFMAILCTACGVSGSESVPVRVGVLPILDSLPMYVAEAQGYFADEGIEIEFVPVSSAPERDQLMQSNQIDAMINELVSVIFYNKDSTEVIAVRFARTANETYPVFRIVASETSEVESIDDLKGVPIGVSEGTVIEYTTDRLLERAGFSSDEIVIIAVPKIPDRLNLLASGQLEAANLPDPAASLAILNGGKNIIDDTSFPEVGHSIISFDAGYIESHPETVRGFLFALERAVEDINTNKSGFSDLISEKGLIPPPLMGSFVIPDYPTASVPSETQFLDTMEWAISEGLIEHEVSYESSVDGSYLP